MILLITVHYYSQKIVNFAVLFKQRRVLFTKLLNNIQYSNISCTKLIQASVSYTSQLIRRSRRYPRVLNNYTPVQILHLCLRNN